MIHSDNSKSFCNQVTDELSRISEIVWIIFEEPEAVPDYLRDPDYHIDTSVVSASHTSTSDHFELAPRIIPSDVDSDSYNTSHPEPHPLGGAPD